MPAASACRAASSSACRRAAIWRLGVGRTFQITQTFGSMTVVENVQQALIAHHRRTRSLWPRAASLYRDEATGAARPGRDGRTRPSVPARVLAYGDLKRVELAIALAQRAAAAAAWTSRPPAWRRGERIALMALTRDDRARARPRRAVHRARHGRGVRPCRPDHGDEPRRAGRDRHARRRCAPTRWCRRSISAPAACASGPPSAAARGPERHARGRGLHAYYGRAHILRRRQPSASAGARWWRCSAATAPASRRRSRCIIGPGAAGAGLDQLRRPATRRAARRTRSRASASATCPRSAACSPTSRSRRTSRSAASRRAGARRTGRPSGCSRCSRTSPSCARRPAGRISGGEQQMLTIARTLMGNPRAILLDEPSEGLAPVIVEQMAATIVELKRDGLTVLLSEQNLRFAQRGRRSRADHRDRRDPLPRHDRRAGRRRGGPRQLSHGVIPGVLQRPRSQPDLPDSARLARF